MIFVTIGNAFQPFRRLLTAMDGLATEGSFSGEPVFMQVGHDAKFSGRRTEIQPFLSMNDFDQRMRDASLIVCHGGCTVFQALRLGKTPVVVPRQKIFGEHINDHQVRFARALAAEGWIVPVYDIATLPAAIDEARRRTAGPARAPSIMPTLVGRAIQELIA